MWLGVEEFLIDVDGLVLFEGEGRDGVDGDFCDDVESIKGEEGCVEEIVVIVGRVEVCCVVGEGYV